MDNCHTHMKPVPRAISLGVLRVECVGPVFLSHIYDTPLVLEDNNQNSNKANDEVSSSDIDYDEPIYESLDGKSMKQQDHYVILALDHLRIKATEDDIKSAYRKQVLRHHPDKRKVNEAHRGQSQGDYFSRITKAWEILGNPQKRRSYDSIDPCFDNSIPSANEYNRNNFYTVFGKAFELNSRWSEKKPVPQLGNDSTAKDDVLHFYSFWYSFVSWREFSYLDDEANTEDCREMRKCVQKINKQQRAKRKKEETARIRKLVDTAYALDPRILRYKKEEEAAKEAAKQAKKNLIKMKREEEERKNKAAEDAIRLEKKRQEEEEKARQNALKAERAANKQALKKARSALRKLVKENNYFCDYPEELIQHMTNTEKLCESLDVNKLNELISTMTIGGREVFLNAVDQVEKNTHDKEHQAIHQTSTTSSASENTKALNIATPWTSEEIQALHKAMVAFPAGANKRWERVSDYINEHYRMQDSVKRSPKEVLLKARELQSNVYCGKTISNSDKIKSLNNSINSSQSGGDAHTSALDMEVKRSNLIASWTPEEQKLLENALIMFPASSPDRWDKVAKHVPNKTKRECMKRYKEIAEMLKLKRTGQNSQLLC